MVLSTNLTHINQTIIDGWASLRVSDPATDNIPAGLIVRLYGMEIAECVSNEINAFFLLMEACSKICHFYDKIRTLPGGKTQVITQVDHLIDVIRKFRTESRTWTEADKIHAVREALNLEETNLTDARKVDTIIGLLFEHG